MDRLDLLKIKQQVGTTDKLAARLKVSTSLVWKMLHGKRRITGRMSDKLERIKNEK